MKLDLLGDFSATKLDAPKPSAVSGPGRPPVAPSEDDVGADVLSEDDFAKELQAGMADLLGEIENSVRRHGIHRLTEGHRCHISYSLSRSPK